MREGCQLAPTFKPIQICCIFLWSVIFRSNKLTFRGRFYKVQTNEKPPVAWIRNRLFVLQRKNGSCVEPYVQKPTIEGIPKFPILLTCIGCTRRDKLGSCSFNFLLLNDSPVVLGSDLRHIDYPKGLHFR
jgi:hypothetical protein